MSIANGKQQKRVNKKQSSVSTAAVYPFLQSTSPVTNGKKSVNSDGNGLKNLDASESQHIRGQCVRGRLVAEHTIVSSVAEFVSEVIPQGNTQHTVQSEPICWVKIQKCACEFRGRISTFVIIIGLARGYQIWTMLENGDIEEVVSERKGPLRIGHLLPFLTEEIDRFRDQRPLLAMVDGNPMSSEQKFCTVSFLSLKQGKIAHSLDLSELIIDIESSAKCLLIVLAEKLIVCDHETYTQTTCVLVAPSVDPLMPPCFALSDNLLAFTEFNLDKQKQSCGGTMLSEEISYSGQMMNAAKSISKTMSSIGESFVSSFSSTHQCKSTGGFSSATGCETADDSGIVTVININNLSQSNEKSPVHLVAHFVAHDSSLIGHLAFSNGGQLLLTGTQNSTTFHLFLLHPHPTSVKLSSVEHIYTLHRGNSAAKVLHSAFTSDNRWLSIATNHGTTHVFAITPYGGPVNARTHCDKFVNKESRFQRSAGITSVKQLANLKNTNMNANEHPAVVAFPVMSKAIDNSRLTYYPPPIKLYSLAKIKQRAFSAENISAWASDNTPALLGGGGSLSSSGRQATLNGHLRSAAVNGYPSFISEMAHRRFALAFDSSFGAASSCDNYNSVLSKGAQPPFLCLYIMSVEGVFIEHRIEVRREGQLSGSGAAPSNSNSSIADQSMLSSSPTGGSSTNLAATNAANHHRIGQQDLAVQAKVVPVMQWILKRNRGASNIEVIDPPLPKSNSLIQLCLKAQKKDNLLLGEDDSCQTHVQNEADLNVGTSWLEQVEVVTYTGPHRRLWMGPQFNFGVYASSGHSSAQLFNPNNGGKHSAFPVLQKCCPVLIEKNPATAINSTDNTTSRIACGSWSSDIVDIRNAFGDTNYASVKEKIEDAMRDVGELFEYKDSQKKLKKENKREMVSLRSSKSSGSSGGTNDSNSEFWHLSGMDL